MMCTSNYTLDKRLRIRFHIDKNQSKENTNFQQTNNDNHNKAPTFFWTNIP